MTTKQREAIKTLSDTNILMNIQRDTALSIRLSIETALALIKEQSAELLQKNAEIAEKDAEIEKKDKIIDLMSEQLAGLTIFDTEKDEPLILTDKEEVINYFENKVNSKIQ